jgi:hypothetical protein
MPKTGNLFGRPPYGLPVEDPARRARPMFCVFAVGISALSATAATADTWCDIPYAPENIYGPEESEFRQEIVAEFEAYMVEARLYINCLEAERQRMFEEVRVQVNIYGQFLERVKREKQ